MNRTRVLSFLLFLCLLTAQAQRPKVGLVLGGGGAKGATILGVLKEIEHAGIPIDYISGTSIGAIVGGLYSVGYRAADLDTLFRSQDWLSLLTDGSSATRGRLMEEKEGITYIFGIPVSHRKNGKHSLSGFGLLHGDSILSFLDSLVINSPVARHAQSFPSTFPTDSSSFLQPIPFCCVTFDLQQYREVVLSSGNLARNMRASMAIPGIFKPVITDSMILADGGMVNNLPVDVVKEMGAEIVIAIDLTQNKQEEYQSPIWFLKGLGGIIGWLAERPDIQRYNKNRKLADLYINPDLGNYGVLSFNADAIADMLSMGRKAGREHYQDLMLLKERLSSSCSDLKTYEQDDSVRTIASVMHQ